MMDQEAQDNQLIAQRSLQSMAGMLNCIPIFTGTDDFLTAKQFFETIEELAVIAGWTDPVKILATKARFKGAAAQFLADAVDVRKERDFTQFKNAVIQRFDASLPITVKLQKFTTCKQKAGESVAQYVTRLRGLAHAYMEALDMNNIQVREMADKMKLSQFLNGLNQALRRQVMAFNPLTFDESVDRARLLEMNDSCMDRQVNFAEHAADRESNSVTQSQSVSELYDFMVKQMADSEAKVNLIRLEKEQLEQKLMLANQKHQELVGKGSNFEAQQEQRNMPRNRTEGCFICNSYDHWKRNCPHRKVNNARPFYQPRYMPETQFNQMQGGYFTPHGQNWHVRPQQVVFTGEQHFPGAAPTQFATPRFFSPGGQGWNYQPQQPTFAQPRQATGTMGFFPGVNGVGYGTPLNATADQNPGIVNSNGNNGQKKGKGKTKSGNGHGNTSQALN